MLAPDGPRRLKGWAAEPGRALAAATVVVLGAAACARPGAPPGGPRDIMPPQVVETSPEPESQVEGDMDFEVVIRFNERISERAAGGSLDNAVLISPEVPGLRVSHRRDGLSLRAPEGWRPRQAYRVRVLPIVQDMFNNPMAAPFEFAFGTGAGIPRGTIAGIVTDRITGQPVEGVRVTAVPLGGRPDDDPPIYLSTTDSIGVFGFRRMPRGQFELQAYTDQNRNGEPDPFEAIDRSEAEIQLQIGDTAIVTMRTLMPDTTAARVGQVEATDPVTLRVVVDDYLDPEVPLGAVSVLIRNDSLPTPGIDGVYHPFEYQRVMDERAEARRVADSARVADSLRAAGEQPPARPAPPTPPAGAQPTGAAPPAPILPSQEFYVLLADSLVADSEYVVRIEGVPNINGLPGGVGVDTLVWIAPVDSSAIDTTTALPDTASTDTLTVPPDTGRVSR